MAPETQQTKDGTARRKTVKKKGPARAKHGTPGKPANGRDLVVVESPAKAKTINKYLGGQYIVKASLGHIRDLPQRGLGVSIEEGFAPTYELVRSRRKVLGELKKLADKAGAVYLATDLDREGEAIAWHLSQALELDDRKVRRVVFNEITRKAVEEAFAHPRGIDMDKVNAQQARRILDRIVGYELSPLLWKKIAKGLSAGRVQSVAVRIVAEREKEIRDFIPDEYWTITGYLATSPGEAEQLAPAWSEFLAAGSEPDTSRSRKEVYAWLASKRAVEATVTAVNGEPFKPTGRYEENAPAESAFASAASEARRVAEALGFVVDRQQETPWQEYDRRGLRVVDLVGTIDRSRVPALRVSDIQTRRTRSKPGAPFTTATLQQAASTQLRLSTWRTMQLAQQLYEGVELPGEDGPIGLITYMRTDSTNLSAESVEAARRWISESCGADYLPDRPNVYASGKRAQEAHEAIRPTDVTRTPESIRSQLSGPVFKLYELIWRRFVACQMAPAEWDSTTVTIKADTTVGDVEFKTSGRTLVFDGFYKVAGEPKANGEQILPELTVGQDMGAIAIDPEQQFTSPPPRYTEASLVKRLEAEGIGRPSTYAAIIQTIQERGYVDQIDRRLYATDKGMIVTDKLVQHFPDVMDLKFTSFMEDELDKIEEAHLDWVRVLHEFYDPFHKDLVRAHDEMDAARAEPSPYKCELCGSDMVYRWGKTGRFLSCSSYPECKGALNVDRQGRPVRPRTVATKCDQCGKDMVLRQSRHGPFLGCSGYPECKNTIPCSAEGEPLKLVTEQELSEPCPACGEGTLRVKRRGMRAFLGCDRYPACKQTKPLPEGVRLEKKVEPPQEAGFNCDRCGRPMHIKTGRRGKFIACSGFPRCRNTKPIEQLESLRQAAPPATDGGAEGQAGDDVAGSTTSAHGRSGNGRAAPGEPGTPPPGFAWTRTGKPVVEAWPESTLSCPQCGSDMQLKAGRFGPFFSCTNFPRCRCSVNLRGEAKKRAEQEMPPPPPKPKPVPTEIPCDECGAPMLIRSGRSGKFLGCSKYPKCKATKPLPTELMTVGSGKSQ